MKTRETIEVGTLRTREDMDRFLVALEAQDLLERGARREDALAERGHGRDALRAIAGRELRTSAQATLRVRWAA